MKTFNVRSIIYLTSMLILKKNLKSILQTGSAGNIYETLKTPTNWGQKVEIIYFKKRILSVILGVFFYWYYCSAAVIFCCP